MMRKKTIIVLFTGVFFFLVLSSCSDTPTDKKVWKYAKNEVVEKYAEPKDYKIKFEKRTQEGQVYLLEEEEDYITYQVTGGFKYKDGSGDTATFTETVGWNKNDKEFIYGSDLYVEPDADSERSNNEQSNVDKDSEDKKVYEAAEDYIIRIIADGDSDLIDHVSYGDSSITKRDDGNYHVTASFDVNSSSSGSYNYEMLLDSDNKILDAYIPGSQGVFDRPMVYDKLGQSAATHLFRDDDSNGDTDSEQDEDGGSDEGKKSLSKYSSEEIEYARVWLQVIGKKDVEKLHVSRVKAGEPLNPYEEDKSAVFPKGLVRLSGDISADGSVYYKSNGDGTINVYKVPPRWMEGIEGDKTMKEYTQDIIDHPKKIRVDPGDDKEVKELIDKEVMK